MRTALVFGGGGFIGSAFYTGFAAEYDQVTVVDRFHGPSHSSLSAYHALRGHLRPQDRIFTGDAVNVEHWPELLRSASDILILNADTGTGSSFAQPSTTIDENLTRLGRLTELIRQHCDPATRRIMFTSSRAVYGEGHWSCHTHGVQTPDRSAATLAAGRFAPVCAVCGEATSLHGSRESDALQPVSVYGLTKAAGEQLLHLTLSTSGFDVRIVRYQNVYGIGQAIDNPYTGVLNWFSKTLLRNDVVKIYEQGLIVRDFIFVSDAAALLFKIARHERPANERSRPYVVNGGTGTAVRLADVALLLRDLYGSKSQVIDVADFRPGDVLGAFADMTRARDDLDFAAGLSLREGLARYAEWFRSELART
jgi:dTDP-L-rhamnose 4-epimerase